MTLVASGRCLAVVLVAMLTPVVPAGPAAATGATPSASVPCPVPVPAVTRPPLTSKPPDDPLARTVGGAALATSGLVVPPGAARPPAVTASSWLVADLDTGAVLGACAPHDFAIPASAQKLLLAATALRRLDPTQVITVTPEDLTFERGSSAVGLLVGGRYTIETLWLGLLLDSGNDAANVLARVAGGEEGVAGTIRAMNEEARRLGALQTHAATPSGLDGPGQFTSAYDLALIARACFAQEPFRRYVTTVRAQIPAQPPADPRGFQIQNDNQLLLRYPGALGGKTGFTTLARHTFVGAAERDGRRLVVTVLRAEARPVRGWQQGAALLDWGFALPRDASVGRLVEPGEPLPSSATAAPTGAPALAGRAPSATPVLHSARAGLPAGWPLLALGLVAVAALTVFAAIRRRPR